MDDSPGQKDGGASNLSTQDIKVKDPTSSLVQQNIQLRTSKDLKPIKLSHQTFTPEEAQKISNGIVMQINQLAGQLFEMHNSIFKLIIFKPRRVYKHLAREY